METNKLQRQTVKPQWLEYGRTEIIWDSLNPKFVKSFIVDYKFEEQQWLKFVVVDIDNQKSLRIEDQDLIGEMVCTLGEIVGAKGQLIVKPLIYPKNKNRKNGFIQVRAEEVEGVNHSVQFQFSATKLDKKDFFGSSDPFLVLSRSHEDGEYQPVHKTEFYKNKLNLTWKPFRIKVQKLCNGDYQRPIRIEVWDWNRSGKHSLIGMAQVTLDQLLKGGKGTSFNLIHPKKKQKSKKYINSGVVTVQECTLIKEYSFLDYIKGGHEISLVVAIDFTASNGDADWDQSLHYLRPGYLNDYQAAIRAVGDILNNYDSDKKYPVFGFGAKIPPRMEVSHCFPINFNWHNPEVYGVDGILQAYNNCLKYIRFHGPTIFRQVIATAANFARKSQDNTYFILLILTDGEIGDMDATIDEIVAATNLPLSIIIVGVGNEDFKKMEILDADDVPLRSSSGKLMERDIVQFVPFNKFKNAHPSRLASEVLAEVPQQFLSYMAKKGIKPRQAIRVESFGIWIHENHTNIVKANLPKVNQPSQVHDVKPSIQINLPQQFMQQQPQQVHQQSNIHQFPQQQISQQHFQQIPHQQFQQQQGIQPQHQMLRGNNWMHGIMQPFQQPLSNQPFPNQPFQNQPFPNQPFPNQQYVNPQQQQQGIQPQYLLSVQNPYATQNK